MNRILLLLFFVINYLFSATVTIECIGKKVGNVATLRNGLNYFNSDGYPETFYAFYDSASTACGGSNPSLVKYTSSFEDGEYVSSSAVVPVDDSRLVVKKKDNTLYNNVIFVNGIPCLPSNTNVFVSWVFNSTDALLDNPQAYTMSAVYLKDSTVALTEAEATATKKACEPQDTSIDYTSYLNKIIDNTKSTSGILSSITDFFSSETTKETGLSKVAEDFTKDNNSSASDTVDGFNDDIVSYATSSFENNKQIINLAGCSAPAPIKATVYGKSFTFFDIATLTSDNVQLIRNIFLLSGYLAGFIVVFRTI